MVEEREPKFQTDPLNRKSQIAKDFTDIALDAQLDTFFLFEIATGKAIRWNKAFRDITGYTDKEIADLPAPASYYSSEDLERAGEFIQNVLEYGAGTIELELICKNGCRVPMEYRVSLIRDEKDEPKHMISIGRDISERKRMEEELSITTSSAGEYNEFVISDTGKGIEENVLNRIFDPFFTTKGKDKGTGLGLFIVQQIVQNHNGFVNVISKKGAGTSFIIRVPALKGKLTIEME